MINKYLILIGRTFIATFILVNFFNTLPFNFLNNAWYVQITMLLVDTASLMLLGLSCLKLVAFLGIKDNNSITTKKELMLNEFNSNEVIKYKRNLVNINKSSKYFFYFFIFIALLQIFVLVNGVSQLDLIYSERVVILEKQFDQIKDEISSNLI